MGLIGDNGRREVIQHHLVYHTNDNLSPIDLKRSAKKIYALLRQKTFYLMDYSTSSG